MEYLFALLLAFITPAYSVLGRLGRYIRVRRGGPPVSTRFIPTTWQVPHGVLALIPADGDFAGDMSFTPPPSWMKSGTFLTDTLFAVEVENTASDFARAFTVREMFLSITPAAPRMPDGESAPPRSLRRWEPPAIGPLADLYVDDPGQTVPRIINVRELPTGPVPLMAAAVSTPVPPHGGYLVATGNCVKFVIRFEFDEPGEYQIGLQLEISESGKESLHSVVEDLHLAQIPDVTDLNVADVGSDLVYFPSEHEQGMDSALADLAQELAPSRRFVARHLPVFCPVTDTWYPVAFVPYLPFEYPTPTPRSVDA